MKGAGDNVCHTGLYWNIQILPEYIGINKGVEERRGDVDCWGLGMEEKKPF